MRVSIFDLFTAADGAGVSAARYRLHFLGSMVQGQESFIFGLLTQIPYAIYLLFSVIANSLMGAVLSSAAWMEPLSEFYTKLTAPIYAVVPPVWIAILGIALVGYQLFRAKTTATNAKAGNGDTLNRLGSGLALTVLIVVLTHNPAAIVMRVMELANGFSVGLAQAVDGAAPGSAMEIGQVLVNGSIRNPTIALNYGAEFSQRCLELWSQAQANGQALSVDTGCFVEGQNAASVMTLVTAIVMIVLPALPMLVFAVVASWKYFLHLTLSVLCFLGIAWVAAVHVHKRRGFDQLSKTLGYAVAHMVMAVITSVAAVALPVILAGLFTALVTGILQAGPDVQVFVSMVGLGVSFIVAGYALIALTANTGILARALRANADTTFDHLFSKSSGPGKAKIALGEKLSLNQDVWKAARKKFGEDKDAANARVEALKKKLDAQDGGALNAAGGGSGDTKKSTSGGTVSGEVSAEDEAAIEELMAPAVAVAEATAADAAAQPDATYADPVGAADTAAGQADSAAAGDVINNDGDSYGYYTDTQQLLSASGPDRDEVATGPGAPGDGPTNTAAAADVVPGAGGTRNAGAAPGGPARPGSPLAAIPQRSLVADAEAGVPPVRGNVFVEPELDVIGREHGATWVIGKIPVVGKVLTAGFQRFSRTSRDTPFDPNGVPAIAQAPPLQVRIENERDDATADTTADAGDSGNAQQQWNRLRRARGKVFGARRRPARPADREATPSGVRPGANEHPSGYHAPMSDFLASAALEVEMEQLQLLNAAKGKRARVTLDPADTRLSVRMSSDPDDRIVPADGVDVSGDPE